MKSRIIRTISVFLVLMGIGSGAYAAIQIKEMNVGADEKVCIGACTFSFSKSLT